VPPSGNGDRREPVYSIADDMAAFDALPPLLRELLRIAPVPIDSIKTLAHARIYGTEATARGLCNWLKRDHPAWEL
jgi:hypothetical protein